MIKNWLLIIIKNEIHQKKASRQGTPNQPKQHGSQYKPLKADAKKKIQEVCKFNCCYMKKILLSIKLEAVRYKHNLFISRKSFI